MMMVTHFENFLFLSVMINFDIEHSNLVQLVFLLPLVADLPQFVY